MGWPLSRRCVTGALSLASVCLGPLRALAQSLPPRPIPLADYDRLIGVGTPARSPGGRRVAFIRTRIVEAENRRHSELRKVPARFVRYPDMYHGGWTPWNTVHHNQQEVLWWAKYLR